MRTTPLTIPHGGFLAEQDLPIEIAAEVVATLNHLPAIELDDFQYHDVICLATGVFSPLKGFQDRWQVASVLDSMRLTGGDVWPIPITLSIPPHQACSLRRATLIRLSFKGRVVGLMHGDDMFWLDPEDEAQAVYGTVDPRHPGVARMLRLSPIRLAGPVTLTALPDWPQKPVLTPRQMRQFIHDRGWHQVVAFQTRNPLHRGHEYIQKTVLEFVDGLVIHPLMGPTKPDDVPASVRWKVYQTLLDHYYPGDRVLLSGFPAGMRYAGPKEALLHALSRKNYGFTHFIVGRDHAGVGSFYDPWASQHIFAGFSREELGITVIPMLPAFYCRRCGQMATEKTCPHSDNDRETLSGTRVRKTLSHGGYLPQETIRPEVEAILREYYHQYP